MSRTPLMHFLKRATRMAAMEVRGNGNGAHGAFASRRDVLIGSAAAATGLLLPFPAGAADARIAIVGGGLAGLTAARELKNKFGLHADVYEGNTRVGGRCFTARGVFAQGQIAEHGGELIDTDHHAIRHLARELGLKLTNVLGAVPPDTAALYMFNGQPYNLADATRDWQPIYDRVQKQSNAIGNFNYKHSTKAAKHFDAMTISDWVHRTIPDGRRSQLGQLIENAFTEENALDADKQSALCAIPTLAEDPKDNFNLYYTDSDQHYHIEGGNDQIATLIANDIGARLISATALIAMKQLSDGRFRLTFAQSSGQFDRVYDRVVLAIPFSVMRAGVDFSKAGFTPLKVQAINTLPMGISCKTQLQFTERKWYEVGCNSNSFARGRFQHDVGRDPRAAGQGWYLQFLRRRHASHTGGRDGRYQSGATADGRGGAADPRIEGSLERPDDQERLAVQPVVIRQLQHLSARLPDDCSRHRARTRGQLLLCRRAHG